MTREALTDQIHRGLEPDCSRHSRSSHAPRRATFWCPSCEQPWCVKCVPPAAMNCPTCHTLVRTIGSLTHSTAS